MVEYAYHCAYCGIRQEDVALAAFHMEYRIAKQQGQSYAACTIVSMGL